MAWDTDPPTQEELGSNWAASPPTAEELSSVGIKKPISKTESGLRGAAQGLSFGTAPAITGAGETLADLLSGKNKNLSIPEAYTKHRQESLANYKAAEEENPVSYIGGEVAGSVPLALLTAGAGEAPAAASLAARLGSAAKVGAAYGAASGAGQAVGEGNISGIPEEAVKGAAGGALLGPAIEGGLSAVKGAGSKLAGMAEQTDIGSKLLGARQMGLEGTNLLNKQTRKDIGQESYQLADRFMNEIVKGPDSLTSTKGKEIENLIKAANDKQIPIEDLTSNLQDKINQLDEKVPIEQGDKQKLQQLLDNFTKEPVEIPKYQVQSVESSPSSLVKLQKQAALMEEQARQEGRDLTTNIYPSSDDQGNKFLNLQVVSDEPIESQEKVLREKLAKSQGLGKPYALDKTQGAEQAMDTEGNFIPSMGEYGSQEGFAPNVKTKTIENIPGTEASEELIPKGSESINLPVESLSPSELTDLKRAFQEYSQFGDKTLSSNQGLASSSSSAQDIGNLLSQQVPGLSEANSQYATLDKALRAMKLKSGSGIKSNAQEQLAQMMGRYEQPALAADKSRARIDNGMKLLSQVSPEQADYFKKAISGVSKRLNIARAAGNEQINKNSLLGAAKGLSVSGANVIGNVEKTVNDMLVKAPKNVLQSMSEHLTSSDNETAQKVGNILSNATERDETGKNALFFTLMQQPQYRSVLLNYFSGVGDSHE